MKNYAFRRLVEREVFVKYGFTVPGGEDFRGVVSLARDAEEAGWDGIFVPDCICIDDPLAPNFDPWAILAAMAVQTERIRLGTMLTPVSRRRPWKLARETMTIDRLSNGRVILAVGLGALDDSGFGKMGEATDRKTRAELMDEGLEIMNGLWSGEPFSFSGKHYKVGEVRFVPTPVQQPRIPVWVVGVWPKAKSMERVLRWDGLLPAMQEENGQYATPQPGDIRAMRAFLDEHHPAGPPVDIIYEGETPGDDPEKAASIVRPYAEAGITWWLDAMWGSPERGDVEAIRRRIKQGPPRI